MVFILANPGQNFSDLKHLVGMVLYFIVALIHIFSKISIAKHLCMTLSVSYLVLLSIQTFVHFKKLSHY